MDFPRTLPDGPGDPFTHNNNFARNAATGGDNDRGNFRGDWNISADQRASPATAAGRVLEPAGRRVRQQAAQRRSLLPGPSLPTMPFWPTYSQIPTACSICGSASCAGSISAPRQPRNSSGKAFGLPSYFDQISALDGVDGVTTLPGIATGFNTISTGFLAARDKLLIVPTLTMVRGSQYTLKFGAELRRQDVNYFQNNNPLERSPSTPDSPARIRAIRAAAARVRVLPAGLSE
jgi:hypothetical protein